MRDRAWVYRSSVSARAMLNKEIRRFLDTAFDGAAVNLIARLADMNEVTLEDLKEIEKHLARTDDSAQAADSGHADDVASSDGSDRRD